MNAVTTLMRISDVQNVLSTSRSTVYRLIESGHLERVYVGSAMRIVDDSVQDYITRLRTAQASSWSDGRRP